MRLAPEILTPREVRLLLDSFGSNPTGIRNRAIVWMFYGVGIKIGEVVQLEVSYYDREHNRLTVPPTGLHPERTVGLDGQAVEALDQWMSERKRQRIRRIAPLFCNVHENAGKRLDTVQIREMLRIRARRLDFDKRIHAEGLRASGRAHRAAASIEHQLVGYLDEPGFRARYPRTYQAWRAAQDLFSVDPKRHATSIGHHCRDARATFLQELAERHAVEALPDSGSVDQLRHILREAGPSSRGINAFLRSLVAYWGSVSDLAERQEHGAAKDGETLDAEDARRLIFHLLIVMNEIDRSLAGSRAELRGGVGARLL